MGIPIFLSGMGRGLMGSTSKYQCRHKESRRQALRECDVIILAGVPCDFRLDYGNNINHRAVLISANRDCVDLYKNRTPTLAVQADACEFLIDLSTRIADDTKQNWSSWLNELSKKDEEREIQIAKEASAPMKDGSINPLTLCKEIESVASPNTIFVADGGDFVGTASYILKPRGPLTWMDPGPFGTLGVGSGFALGAKLVHPESEVWVIFGDGAVGFSIAEFDTFVRHNIPVIAVVGNDAAWNQILRGQVEWFKTDVACALAPTNYEEVAKGFGAEGVLIKDQGNIANALKKAQQIASVQKKPVLVNAIIGRSDFRQGSLAM